MCPSGGQDCLPRPWPWPQQLFRQVVLRRLSAPSTACCASCALAASASASAAAPSNSAVARAAAASALLCAVFAASRADCGASRSLVSVANFQENLRCT
jgi:hypothetical protein